MELPFAGLHQLCLPLLDLLPNLPDPQQDALQTVFGHREGSRPDRLLLGLAVLSLLCEAAEGQPLLCLIDDGHWLDRASAQALGFVGRRVLADPVGLIVATREVDPDFSGLPELVLEGLAAADAAALLRSLPGVPADTEMRDRIVAEAQGNPLALLEWYRAFTPAEAAWGLRLPASGPLSGRLEESYRRRVAELPAETQLLLLVAAAERFGEALVVWRAADWLGVGGEAVVAAEDAGLVQVGAAIRFRHPLVRSAAYNSASRAQRQRAHRALAEVIGSDLDPDRRAWHFALAAAGPDEEVAAELERCAGRAQRRGGAASAAAFLERSADLTLDPDRRTERTISAAARHFEAGAVEASSSMLAAAEGGPLDELQRARAENLRGNIEAGWGHFGEATELFLRAARRLEPFDVRLARSTYVRALLAADIASDLARGATIVDVAKAARNAPGPPDPGHPQDLLLDGLAINATDGPPVAAPKLREALHAVTNALHSPQTSWLLGHCLLATELLWDYDTHYTLATRYLQTARELGALQMLTWALDSVAQVQIWEGDLATAASLLDEEQSIIEATGSTTTPTAAADLMVWRGDEAEAKATIAAGIEKARVHGQGGNIKVLQLAEATMYNALRNYDDALTAAQSATRSPLHNSAYHALPELIEGAVRSGQAAVAAEALERLSGSAHASGTDWALGVYARSRALLSTGDAAETYYREAIERLDRSPLRPEAARAHLLYGEWLRREKGSVEAREQLRMAYELFDVMGARTFAERARVELAATGERARRRRADTTADLTPQERQIAQMAANGATNREIANQLFLSASTVDYHLRKVFQKLQITRRRQLHKAIASG
jgi:DNA-binding CsgD family transcriptional regulator